MHLWLWTPHLKDHSRSLERSRDIPHMVHIVQNTYKDMQTHRQPTLASECTGAHSVHVCTSTYKHVCKVACVHVSTYVHLYLYNCASAHVYMTYIKACLCMFICCRFIYELREYPHAYTHVYIHTHTSLLDTQAPCFSFQGPHMILACWSISHSVLTSNLSPLTKAGSSILNLCLFYGNFNE